MLSVCNADESECFSNESMNEWINVYPSVFHSRFFCENNTERNMTHNKHSISTSYNDVAWHHEERERVNSRDFNM